MRRREKFVIVAVLLGVVLWLIQLTPINWRDLTILLFGGFTYFASALALRKGLSARMWFTFLPLPALYSLAIGFFYFLLPTNFWSLVAVLGLFSLGMYALFLTGNILTPRERTIQLHRAAQNVTLFFSTLISLLGVHVILSFNLPFYLNFALVLVLHYFLSYAVIWSVDPHLEINFKSIQLAFFSALLIGEISLTLSFLPLAAWHIALLIMAVFYLITGILNVYLSAKLFKRAIAEYLLLTVFVVAMFVIFFPGK